MKFGLGHSSLIFQDIRVTCVMIHIANTASGIHFAKASKSQSLKRSGDGLLRCGFVTLHFALCFGRNRLAVPTTLRLF